MSFEVTLDPCDAVEHFERIIRTHKPRKIHENMETLQSSCGSYEIKAWRTRRTLGHCCDVDVIIRKSNHGSLVQVRQRGKCRAIHAQKIEDALHRHLPNISRRISPTP